MTLESVETILHWLGGLLPYVTLAVILYGLWRGARRQPGRVTGKVGKIFHSPWFFLIFTAIYIGFCLLGWVPLPLNLSPQAQLWTLVIGSILYFPGMSLVLWGRLALGKNYFISSGFGAQLFTGHQLVDWGPFAIVRHPMYLGVILAAAGSLLVYFTWTTVSFVAFAPFLTVRSRREEALLASEFGEQWQEYCQRVPAFFPRFRKERTL